MQISRDPSSFLGIPAEQVRGRLLALLGKLGLRNEGEIQRTAAFLAKLYATPPRLAPPVEGLEERVKKAVFWHDVRNVKRFSGVGRQSIPLHERISHDFIECDSVGQLHTLSNDFWEAVELIARDSFLQLLMTKLRREFEKIVHPTLVPHLEATNASFTAFALVSHCDTVLLRKGTRFSALFDLYFEGNHVVAYDHFPGAVGVLVAPT